MPFVNVIQGEQVPSSVFNVRTPVLRIPLWMVITWQVIKAVAWVVFFACRYYYVTAPSALLGWLYLEHGWAGPGILLGSIAAIGCAWGFGHLPSFLRFGWWPILARYRRMIYRAPVARRDGHRLAGAVLRPEDRAVTRSKKWHTCCRFRSAAPTRWSVRAAFRRSSSAAVG